MDLIDRLNDATGRKRGVDQYISKSGIITLPWAKLLHLQDDLNLIYGMDAHIQGSRESKLEVLRRMAELEGVKLVDGWDIPEPSEPLTALEFELLSLLYRFFLHSLGGRGVEELRGLVLEIHRVVNDNWSKLNGRCNDEK